MKMQPKSPTLKALIGNQKNLPEALKAQIQAAPESPAKQTKTKGEKKAAKRASQSIISSDTTYTYHTLRNNPASWMSKPGKGAYEAAADTAGRIARKNEEKRSPAKNYKKGYYGV